MVNKLRLILLGLAALAVGFSLFISVYHLAYLNKIFPFLQIGPVEVGNLPINLAQEKIAQVLPDASAEIILTFGSQSWPIKLTGLEISYDPLLSAQTAYLRGRDGSFFSDLGLKWRQWRRPAQLPLVFNFSQDRLQAVIDDAVTAINEEPIEPALILNRQNQVELIPGRNGRIVDRELFVQSLNQRLGLLDLAPFKIPTKLITIDLDDSQLAQVQTLAEAIKDRQLTLTYQDFSQKLSGQPLLDLISFTGGFDENKIASLSSRLAQKLDRPVQNAAWQFDGQRVVEFKPALPGLTINQAVSRQVILNALDKMGRETADQTVELIVDTSQPSSSIADVNNLGIKELLGKGESTFRGSIPGRKHNIALAAGRLNGLLVAPGDSFSFNQIVGDISQETGYQTAYIIKDGRTVLGDGGGVCQVSTTLFRAILNAGLEVIERHPHSYRVGYYEQNSPAGLDATVYAPGVDFKFRNDTNNHILIQATVDTNNAYLRFDLYGAGDGRQASITNNRLWDQIPPPDDLYVDDPALPAGQTKQIDWKAWGAKAAFDWTVVRDGETIRQKTFYSSYQPWQAVFLRGTGI